MKNFIFILSIFLIVAGVIGFKLKNPETYKVLKVIKGDTFCVDLNNNSVCDADEVVKLADVEAFGVDNSQESLEQAKRLKISSKSLIGLGYLSKEFSKGLLEGQNVKLTIIDKAYSPKKVEIFLEGKNVSDILVENGYATDSTGGNIIAVVDNLDKTKDLDLVYLNLYSLKYHNLNCKYVNFEGDFELMERYKAMRIGQACKECSCPRIISRILDERNIPYFSDKSLSLYLTNPTLFHDAPDTCRTALSKELLKNINEAKISIDFAMYGFEGQKKIVAALKNAKDRGVKIRWVTDLDSKGASTYLNTKDAMKILPDFKTDFDGANSSNIMHNKFFIIDGKTLITGSANLSNTDMAGLNSNAFIKINSPELCAVYEKEFEQMYHGRFHKSKEAIPNKTGIKLSNNNIASIFFSPKDKAISNALIPIINQSKDYVYIPIFFLTDKNITTALISAKKRGIDVKVLLDAVAAENSYSCHKELRAAKIPVKVENWAGKMHQKSMIVDDNTVVIGSMNFSKSGELSNDENCIVLQNAPNLAKKYRQYFLMLYNSVPDKYLVKTPRPEAPESIGSCQDGVDNDFDGLIDLKDSGCFGYKKY